MEETNRRRTKKKRKPTANDVERATGNIREKIDPVTVIGHHVLMGLSQLIDQHNALLVEDVNKIFQDLEMECRSQHFATPMPFGAAARE